MFDAFGFLVEKEGDDIKLLFGRKENLPEAEGNIVWGDLSLTEKVKQLAVIRRYSPEKLTAHLARAEKWEQHKADLAAAWRSRRPVRLAEVISFPASVAAK